MRIPTDLRRELRGYFQQLRQTSLLFEDERRLLARLSPELRSRVQRLANSGLIKKVPFFKNAGDRCIADILAGLEQQLYVPGEIVINEGDIGREMFFVKQGVVEISPDPSPHHVRPRSPHHVVDRASSAP